ncbi:LuxR family transcriptional regulator [Reticulibacter mediterranei]|uniref:LuxR family transcriptional regulator n=1 Tax=Reticulibacter mediterranei TaxID=2778369 RepID=A0A8J3N688_9CHLR|nr:LuxR C-terminal-related transcriptional regulator [Reticulibacter mediterranei]GHP00103.1 LuxR family transcriptional regulator [Reticulibacter mediterranei]
MPEAFTSSSLLLPKLRPPRLLSSLVARPRLLARLDAALESKVTLLVAPAGFGKTTVIGQWLHDRQAKLLIWVSLDSSDNDLFRFWHSIIAAYQTFQPDLGRGTLALLYEATQPPFVAQPPQTPLTLLLNELTQQQQDTLLVLDDYHAIEEPAIHETLTFFLDHLPNTLHVLLLSRNEPPLPLLRWRARGDIAELHAADLRFTPEETAAFTQQAFSAPLSDAALKQLDASVQGWAAGLRLLSLSLAGQRSQREVECALISLDKRAESFSPYRPLRDYLVTEILNAQPPELQHFLLQTSALGRLSGPLCDAVTLAEGSATRLEAIAQAGLFLEALDGAGGWYRFHALFAEVLRREAVQHLGETELRALSLRASRWYEQHGLIEEAIEAALRAYDFEHAALLIERVDMDGEISEQYTVRRWLESMPEAVLRVHPMLCWLAALSFQMLQEDSVSTTVSERVERLLHMAEEGWHRQEDLASLGLIAVFHAMSAWRSVQFPRATEYAQQALAMLPDNEQERHIQVWCSICQFIVGVGFMYDDRFEEARSSFLQAHARSLISRYQRLTRGLLLLIGACNYVLGELQQAHEYYQQVLSAARRQSDREVLARALLGLANIAFEWNDLAHSEQQVGEALALAPEDLSDLRNDAALQLAQIAHARGQITSAQQQIAVLLARLQTATAPEASSRHLDALVFSAHLALETGDIQAAQHILERPALQDLTAARVVQTRILLVQSRPQEALQQLESLLPDARAWRLAVETRILLALTHAACQHEREARECLRQALSLARSEGLVRIFLSEGNPLARLLRQLIPTLHEPALRSYVQSILRAFATPADHPPSDTTSSSSLLVQSLSTQEQRVLRLLAAGRSNLEIAQDLVVSINTVKDHVKNLYRKLGVTNRLQASEVGRRLHLIDF